MTTTKLPLTHLNKPGKETPSSMLADWQARHSQAMRHPQTLFEQAFVQMLQGWECYARAHQTAYEGHILSDGVLGDCWSAIGEGLLGLLNGERNRLDGGTLDRAIRQLLEPPKAEEEASSPDAAPGGKEEKAAEDTLQTWPPGVTQPLRAPEEQALIAMLHPWRHYGKELQQVAGAGYYTDATFAALRQGWRQIGEGLCLLLHSQMDDLDAQVLEGAIRDTLALPLEQEKEIPEWNFFDHWEPSSEPDYDLCCYSRADALADSVLIDVTATAKEAGFRIPVALTAALWADIHAIPERLQGIADPKGRLWDVLFVGHFAMRQQAPQSSFCLYHLEMPVGQKQMPLYEVKAVCGPGDSGEPVLTLMQPGED